MRMRIVRRMWGRARMVRRIRVMLALFMLGVVVSGLTAFPLAWEVRWLDRFLVSLGPHAWPPLVQWIAQVDRALATLDSYHYRFLYYGTDWLAFAHLVIALAFLGPYRDPVRNKWVVEWGMLTCAFVLPLAVWMGPLRGIPFWWQLIDCAFGVVGLCFLWPVHRMIRQLEASDEPADRDEVSAADAAGVSAADAAEA